MITENKIASDLMDYLREKTAVCVEGNAVGWRWVRFEEGEWQAVKYANGRIPSCVVGTTLDDADAKKWLIKKPATIIPQRKAYKWKPADNTVWEETENQDVFSDVARCYWCGISDRSHDLHEYETTEDGFCSLCLDCYETWDSAGEIISLK